MPIDPVAPTATPPVAPTLREALGFWGKLGFISFGGPAGQIALMHAELVERRRWLSEGRFLHALNYCMLLPGPEAQQLATYTGWLMHGTRGGIAAGLLFILPALLLMIGLGWAYMVFGGHPLARDLLYGVQPAVVALVAQAGWRLGSRTLKTRLHRAIALGSLLAVALETPFPLVLLAAAVLGIGLDRAPTTETHASVAPAALHPRAWIDDDTPPPAQAAHRLRALWVFGGGGLVLGVVAYALLLASDHVLLSSMAWFFTKAALLTFGGAYAVLPYVMQAAVEVHGWVTTPQMITALALGESTPGPLIMIVSFVGFLGGWQQPMLGTPLASGVAAALVASFFTFLPSFVFILAGAPWVEATRGLPRLAAPLRAISAAVVGVIVQLGLVLALHVLWPDAGLRGRLAGLEWPALLIGTGAALALLRWRLGVIPVLAGSALLGLLVQSLAR
ncbi:chromate efflux transporter [Rivibacter subsaxonicus]|nr:chromate efflux transporter [Rivibacter subsaxonicus]